jgi:hypothetical protein
MKTFSEENLIAYHLGELSWWKKTLLRRRLLVDVELAADSEEIAETLRAFSPDPAPIVSEALLERSWRRVRGSLGHLEAPPRTRRRWIQIAAPVTAVALIAIAAIFAIPRMHGVTSIAETKENGVAPVRNWSHGLLSELRGNKPHPEAYNHRPGPLTTGPVDAVAEEPALAAHLDTAERVLTEVSHTNGTLQPETREQVHRLLLENAVYRKSAEQHGDMETAAVIEDLGRVLTSLDAEPLDTEREAPHAENHDAFRLEMNLGGVLLDLRILHSSDRSSK